MLELMQFLYQPWETPPYPEKVVEIEAIILPKGPRTDAR
jgi:hypothetical protein